MGIFYDQVTLVNRTPVDLTVMFDGQAKTLKPGPNTVPEVVVSFAKNQNPVMGSQDPGNPHMSGARYLVGVQMADGVAFPGDEIEPLTLEEWEDHLNRPCREDERAAFEEKYSGDPQAKLVVHGKGRKIPAKSRYEAGGNAGGNADFSSKD